MRAACLVLAWVILAPAVSGDGAQAQERSATWQRRGAPTEAPVTVFHSPQSANLPTGEMLRAGEWLFEISHRFLPPVSEGADALWGFDGPVYNRLGLAYAPTDELLIGLVRSNLDDNLDLSAKVRLAEGGRGATPWMVGLNAGIAFNTDAPFDADENEMQAYGQAILNLLLGEKLGVGVVPSLLYNPVIGAATKTTELALGLNAQLYVSEGASFLAEWVFTPEHDGAAGLEHDGGTFGIELETGGHFFKVLLTNQVRMNPTQYLAGSPFAFEAGEWRVGFNITRLLAF